MPRAQLELRIRDRDTLQDHGATDRNQQMLDPEHPSGENGTRDKQ